MKETKGGREITKEDEWGVLLPCLSPTPWRLGEGRAEMVSTVTAGSWWPGMWAINSAVGRFTPPLSPSPLLATRMGRRTPPQLPIIPRRCPDSILWNHQG